MQTSTLTRRSSRSLIAEQFPELDASSAQAARRGVGQLRVGRRGAMGLSLPAPRDRDRRRRARARGAAATRPASSRSDPGADLRRATERALPLAVLRRTAPARRRARRRSLTDDDRVEHSAQSSDRFLRVAAFAGNAGSRRPRSRAAGRLQPSRRHAVPRRARPGEAREASRLDLWLRLAARRAHPHRRRGASSVDERARARPRRSASCAMCSSSGGPISGVIDWGDVCRADPAIDLMLVWCSSRPPDACAFFAPYGQVDAEQFLRSRVLALFLDSMLVRYAHDRASRASNARRRRARANADRLVGDAAFENRREPRGVDVPARDDADNSSLTGKSGHRRRDGQPGCALADDTRTLEQQSHAGRSVRERDGERIGDEVACVLPHLREQRARTRRRR